MRPRWTTRRRREYTVRGIRRLDCIGGCGRRAFSTWSICADRNVLRPLCIECDIAINRMVLEYMRHPEVDRTMAAYERRVRAEAARGGVWL